MILTEKNLHNYQSVTAEHIFENNFAGLFLGLGLGKTISTLTAINRLIYQELEISKVLVIAPKRVAENVWSDEIEKWGHVKHLRISVVAGTQKQRLSALKKDADIYMLGRDNVAWICGLFGGSMLPFDMFVIDESSSFKNPKSQRFKAFKATLPSFKRGVILTATPAPNSLIDLWSQVFLLDRGVRLSKFITRFREEYFKPGQTNGAIVYNYRIQKDGEQRIYDKIGDICISMKAEDYLELPGRVVNFIEVKFPPELQKKYDDFEKEMVLELYSSDENEEGEDISALNSAALSNKLLQFANGAVYDENKKYHVVHDLKLEALQEIIDNAGGKPILVAWTYRSDMYRMMERFKKLKPRELKDGKDIKDWNAGKIQLLLMHPASGGHGLNLQAGGNIIVWFGQTWSLELFQQFNGRLDRQGKTEVTVINQIVARDTMDLDVIKSQDKKAKNQDALINAVKARIDKYINHKNK